MSDVSELGINNTVYDINSKSITDQNGGKLRFWTGTRTQYDAIATKDDNTIYNVEDSSSLVVDILNSLYPIGAIYIGTMSACPLQTLGVGTWQLVAQDRVLQGAGTRGSVGTTVNESLPNITGTGQMRCWGTVSCTGAFEDIGGGAAKNGTDSNDKYLNFKFDASNSSSTYQDNAPVQQDGYLVNIWERTA